MSSQRQNELQNQLLKPVSKRHLKRRIRKEKFIQRNRLKQKFDDISVNEQAGSTSSINKNEQREAEIPSLSVNVYATTNVSEGFVSDASIDYTDDASLNNYECNSVFTRNSTINEVSEEVSFTNYEGNNEALQNISFSQKLANWAVTCHIPHEHLNSLLKILREENINVPKCSKTLLETPRSCSSITVKPGLYCHIGVEKGIRNFLKQKNISCNEIPDFLEINVNIDGLPISKEASFWPIMGYLSSTDLLCHVPFVIGVYHGSSKPDSSSEFLNSFIIEMVHLYDTGFEYYGKRLKVKVKNLICDAPAKAFVLCVKGHNSAHGCSKCYVEGSFGYKTITFLDLNNSLRTDKDFRQKVDDDYHKGVSPLENLTYFDLVKNVPLDYMHLVLLGVCRKYIFLLIKGKMGTRLLPSKQENLNSKLLKCNSFITADFARKPRDVYCIDKWKATEVRQFLLYTGPHILKGVLSENQYTHFMFLHIAIRILATPHLCQLPHFNDNAKELLRLFIENYQDFFPEQDITYNLHSLIHLPDDVLLNGNLDLFSAFPFENHMQQLKRSVQNGNLQLQQLVKRIAEQEKQRITSKQDYCNSILSKNGNDFVSCPVKFDLFYDVVITEKVTIKRKFPDCFYMLKDNATIIKIFYIGKNREDADFKLIVKKVIDPKSYYNILKIDSRALGFFQTNSVMSDFHIVPLNFVKQKCILLQEEETCIYVTIIHQS